MYIIMIRCTKFTAFYLFIEIITLGFVTFNVPTVE